MYVTLPASNGAGYLGCGHLCGGKTSYTRKFVEKLTNEGYRICFISTDWFYMTSPKDDTPSAFDFQPLITSITNR